MKSLVLVCVLGGTAAAAPWVQEIVDYELFPSESIAIMSTAEGPAILASPGSISRTVWLVRGRDGWRGAQVGNGGRAVAIVNREPWFVMYDNRALVLRRGKTTETIVKGAEEDDAAAIVVDAAGTPHVCIAAGQVIQGDRPASLTLRYATRGKRGWTVEPLAAKGHGCTIAVGTAGTAIGTNDGIAMRTTGAWQVTSLGGPTRVVADANGKIAAVTARGTSLVVTRDGASSVLADKLVGPWQHAVAADAQGRVHVVAELKDPRSVSSIVYAVEGTPGTQLVANADAMVGLAIAVDAAGQPSIAFGSHWQQTLNQTLRFARPRTALDTRDIVHDIGAIVAACGAEVSDELANVPRDDARVRRLCAAGKQIPAAELELDKRCKQDPLACLVGVPLGDKRVREHVDTFEITFDPCGKGKRCTSQYTEVAQVGQAQQPASKRDGTQGVEAVRAACTLGHAAACLQAALLDQPGDFDTLVAHCSPTLPLACMLALVDARATKTPSIETALAAACKAKPSALACNGLAFVEEARGANAQKHHVQACVRGAGLSCAKLVGKARAPKELDAETLASLLVQRCDNHVGIACVALADAYARGWVLGRDTARAKEVLEAGCNARLEEPCKKLGRTLPAE